jgi:hypothetical protein
MRAQKNLLVSRAATGPRSTTRAARWVAVDGGYAQKGFLGPARPEGYTVVSRLRKDAAR